MTIGEQKETQKDGTGISDFYTYLRHNGQPIKNYYWQLPSEKKEIGMEGRREGGRKKEKGIKNS